MSPFWHFNLRKQNAKKGTRTSPQNGGDRELARAWEISDVDDVLRRHGAAGDAGGGLCLVRIDPDQPLVPSNARPMPTHLARGRHHRGRAHPRGRGAPWSVRRGGCVFPRAALPFYLSLTVLDWHFLGFCIHYM